MRSPTARVEIERSWISTFDPWPNRIQRSWSTGRCRFVRSPGRHGSAKRIPVPYLRQGAGFLAPAVPGLGAAAARAEVAPPPASSTTPVASMRFPAMRVLEDTPGLAAARRERLPTSITTGSAAPPRSHPSNAPAALRIIGADSATTRATTGPAGHTTAHGPAAANNRLATQQTAPSTPASAALLRDDRSAVSSVLPALSSPHRLTQSRTDAEDDALVCL